MDVKRENAAALFEGVVVAKRVVLKKDPGIGYWPINEYDFAPINIWKGEPARLITVRGGVPCAIEFSPGRRYVVFAVRYDETLANMGCGPSASIEAMTKYSSLEEHFGTPLARFPPPTSLPGTTAAAWYAQRASFMTGVALLAELTDEDRIAFPDEVRTASLGIAATGALAVLVLLIGAATNFRRRRRALVLLMLAAIVAVAMVTVAGRVYLSDPANAINLRWQHPWS